MTIILLFDKITIFDEIRHLDCLLFLLIPRYFYLKKNHQFVKYYQQQKSLKDTEIRLRKQSS